MSPDPDELSAEGTANEAELARLRADPDRVGPVDPAARERELDRRQHEIEFELGQAYYRPDDEPDDAAGS